MDELIRDGLAAFNVAVLIYFLMLNSVYTLLVAQGYVALTEYARRRALRDYDLIGRSQKSTPISIVVPAYNEGPVIVPSVRSLLGVHYDQIEIVVVNDGSTDDTLSRLADAFELWPVSRVPRSKLPSAEILGVYRSAVEPRLVVIDKVNGGKADALNAGISYARYPLFCAVDSDTVLDVDALSRLAWSFQDAPETVAVGGIVRIVNGCTIDGAKVVDVRTPNNLLACLQIVEYLRAFLVGRVGWSRMQSLLIISGAFGLFRRDVVVEAGGYRTDTVGEDAELVVRLHHHLRHLGRPYKISFVADPVCWTEAPDNLRTLARQRDRWQRGLIETLWWHRGMLARRRYGRIGSLVMPYFIVFEALGPLLELAGYLTLALALWHGAVDPVFALAFGTLALGWGMALTFGALIIEERAFQRYDRWSCLLKLLGCAIIENFGYRQWSTVVRAKAFWTLWRTRGTHTWGEMHRAGFTAAEPA